MDLEQIRNHKSQMIISFAIPSIIAMVLTSLITVADGFFIGNYVEFGKENMAAVNLGLPIVYLFLGVGLMISVGGVSIAGRLLGAKEIKKSIEVFNQTMLVMTILSILLSVIVFVCFEPILKLFNAQGIVAIYFKAYYSILLFELPLLIINSSFGIFIRGEGNPQFVMLTNIVNVVLNIVLDWWFAKYLKWGVEGIAYASLISVIVALGMNIFYILKSSKVFKFAKVKIDKIVLRETFLNGSSEFIGEMSMCISMAAYNFMIMRHFGSDGVTAFTIVGYVAYVFSMIILGFGQGANPLVSFSYGAKEKVLARSLRKRTSCFVFAAGLITVILMIVLSPWYSNLFVKNEVVSEMVKHGILLFVPSFLFSGINTIASFYFTSIGKAKESAVISSSRGLVVLLICIFTLPLIWGMDGIWLSSPITEFLTLLLSILFILKDSKDN